RRVIVPSSNVPNRVRKKAPRLPEHHLDDRVAPALTCGNARPMDRCPETGRREPGSRRPRVRPPFARAPRACASRGPSQSVVAAGENLIPRLGSEGAPNLAVDRTLDCSDPAVGEEHVDDTRVPARGRVGPELVGV